MSSDSRSGALCLLSLAWVAVLAAVLLPTGAAGAAAAGPDGSRRMAVTVDDLPVAPPGRHTTAQQEAITERLLAVLADHRVPAVGFVNESKLEVDGAVDLRRVELLERWLDAGHELGNHGYATSTSTGSTPIAGWRTCCGASG